VESGRSLELDGYSKRLRLAFEHQGMHHYEKARYGVLSEDGAEEHHRRTAQYDKTKRQRCEGKGVTLIAVPEIPRLLNVDKVRDFIRAECEAAGYPIPPAFDKHEVDLRAAYEGAPQARALEEMRELARARGGECLSQAFTNIHTKLRWRCAEGHEWGATPASVKHLNSWCPKCAGLARLTIEEVREFARERGGECLSTEYVNNRTRLRWRCAQGHEWESTYDNIQTGKWCPECGGVKRLTLEDAKRIAVERGGECLSAKFKNAKSKLRWRCSKGHVWDAALGHVKNSGSWCPVCAARKRAR
jgi:hypothetical protein